MPTMIKPIDQDYRRVISAKFAKTRQGKDITCRYCSNVIVVGRDLAAVDAIGKWHNVCSVCAVSRAAQITGLVQKVEALAGTLTGASLDALIAQAGAIDALCTAAIGGDDQAAKTVTPALLGLLDQVIVAAKPVDPFGAEVERLHGFVALGYLNGRDQTFADSLVKQWETKGYLSDKQKPWVTTLIEKAEIVAADIIVKPLTEAILARSAHAGGPMVGGHVAAQPEGRASLRFAIPSEGNNDLDFLAVYVGRIERHTGGVGEVVKYQLATAQAVTLGARIQNLNDESFIAAQALYGQAMGQCGRCGSPLTDQVSRSQGFGPDCIKFVGL